MAVKWAVANGNWDAGATWNDGVVPTIDDVVYLDGHSVGIRNTICNCQELRNDLNPNTNLTGGAVSGQTGNSFVFNGDIHCTSVIFILSNGSMNSVFVINGNCTIEGNSLLVATTAKGIASSVINGNINAPTTTRLFGVVSPDNGIAITINGSIYAPLAIFAYATTNSVFNVTLNGNVTLDNITTETVSSMSQEFNCSGVLTVNADTNINSYVTLYANKIYYKGNFPFLLSKVLPLDSNLFECKYIGTEPNPNPYIIVNPNTIADTYPTEDKVLAPTQYGAQMELVGTYTPDYPPESVVLKDYEYGDSGDRKTGTMVQEVNVEVGCVTPEDVRKDVPLVGMGVVGTLVVPSVDDVREGVVFDNGSVGTLIVQGGGDRLRIADFGYYTNAQSDTYIVDLTEQDKPKFAVAEERVLIEMFPELDLNNIPDKYFDDLFVKYLKYRLIVEYYRTAGINSTFTPSEPTTEIVNYQNVRNEVWLNSANIYLKAWSKKYPESITKPQRILL